VRVTSIAGLLSALGNNAVTDITVANGTYHVSAASDQASDSLWIGAKFASRTAAVTVHAETTGGVTFDGAGTSYFGCISFEAGAHDQVWDGFTCASGTPTSTGVITFGGYAGMAAPHHITLRNFTLPKSLTTTSTGCSDHAVYFSEAVGGPHDILIDGMKVDGSGGLDTAIHAYHSDASNANAWNVTIRNLQVTGTAQAIVLWDNTLHNWLISNTTITNATNVAVRYESNGANMSLNSVTSTNSGGFYSSLGSNPPGLTFINDSLH
jgi:hypothetical protein